MARKICRNDVLRAIWVQLVVGSILLASCMPRPCHKLSDPAWLFRHPSEIILIRDAGRLHALGTTKVLSGKLGLGTIVTGHVDQAELSSYEILLDITAHYPELPSRPTFHPENILLLFEGIPMTSKGSYSVVSKCSESFDIQVAFSCDTCLQRWCGFEDETCLPNEIVIDLSRYVKYAGEFVHVEPIEAIDNRNRPDSLRFQD